MVLAPCKCGNQGKSGAITVPKILQIKIHYTKVANLCGFGHSKIQKKKLEKRYSTIVRVVEQYASYRYDKQGVNCDTRMIPV